MEASFQSRLLLSKTCGVQAHRGNLGALPWYLQEFVQRQMCFRAVCPAVVSLYTQPVWVVLGVVLGTGRSPRIDFFLPCSVTSTSPTLSLIQEHIDTGKEERGFVPQLQLRPTHEARACGILPSAWTACLSVCLSCLLSLPRERAGDCVVHSTSEPRGMLPGRGPQGGARCGARYGDAAGSCSGGRQAGGRALAGGSSRLRELQRCPQTPQSRSPSSPAGYRRMGSMGRGVPPPGAARLRLNNRPKEAGSAAGGGGAEGVPCFE